MTSRFTILVLGFVLGALAPASARPLTEAETSALADKVAEFNAAISGGDYETIIEVIPPAMLAHIANQAGVPVEQLLVGLKGQIKEIFASVDLVSFGMDLAAAEERELADGSPFVLIPTTTVMAAEGLGRMQVDSHTLGLLEESDWYLLRVSDAAMVGVLRQVYPPFAGVEFPAETMKALED